MLGSSDQVKLEALPEASREKRAAVGFVEELSVLDVEAEGGVGLGRIGVLAGQSFERDCCGRGGLSLMRRGPRRCGREWKQSETESCESEAELNQS